jgi:hypothetical protein
MNQFFIRSLLLLILILSGCSSSPNIDIEVSEPFFMQKDKATLFKVAISENNKPLTDLKVTADFSMKNMDHGQYQTTLQEEKDGIYSGNIELPMAGDWEIFITAEKGSKVTEEVLEYEVKEPEGVALINGDWITEKDMEFYLFINKLHIAISRSQDEQTYKGNVLDEAMGYWDAQEKMNEDRNQLLTQIIRLRSMAYLSIEKGHKATKEEVSSELEKVKEQYNQFDIAKKMIQEYGDQRFWEKQEKQYELIVLSKKIQQDLIEKVKKENPGVNEQEIYYLAQKQYEELLVSQVNSLKIEFF